MVPLSLKCNICQPVWAKPPPFIDSYIVVLMLAFGLGTVRKLLWFFLPSITALSVQFLVMMISNNPTTCCHSLSVTVIIMVQRHSFIFPRSFSYKHYEVRNASHVSQGLKSICRYSVKFCLVVSKIPTSSPMHSSIERTKALTFLFPS